MINVIPIIIDERGNVRKDIMVLGRENENLSKTLSITIPKSISDKWLYIEFENDNKFTSPKLEANNCKINYDVPQSLMKKGTLKCQVVAKDSNNIIWKANTFEFQIYSSINATDQVNNQATPNIADGLQSQIDQIKQDINAISGIDGGHLATDEDIKELQKQLDNIIVEETDPTVPTYVKSIKENDINNWNNKASIKYVDTKVADLVNSAPGTLDTLGEVAKAIQENESVVEALNSAIGNKANKTYVESEISSLNNKIPTFTAIELEDGSYSLTILTTEYTNILKAGSISIASKMPSSEIEAAYAKGEVLDENNQTYSLGLIVGHTYQIKYSHAGTQYTIYRQAKQTASEYYGTENGVVIPSNVPDSEAVIGDNAGYIFIFDKMSWNGIDVVFTEAENESFIMIISFNNGEATPAITLDSIVDVTSVIK